MSQTLEITATTDEPVSNSEIRDALRDTMEDVSETSPVSGIRDVTTAREVVDTPDGGEEYRLTLAASGDSEFTRTSTDALKDAVVGVVGDPTAVEVEGGYETPEPDDSTDESADSSDDSADEE